jgi:hypothetical protein
VRAGEVRFILQRRFQPLSRELQQAEFRDPRHLDPCLIAFQGIFEAALHLLHMLAIPHIDEIDDDEPTQVAQA